MFSGIILSYQTITGCKLEYLPTDSPEEPIIFLIMATQIHFNSHCFFLDMRSPDRAILSDDKLRIYPISCQDPRPLQNVQFHSRLRRVSPAEAGGERGRFSKVSIRKESEVSHVYQSTLAGYCLF